ncbi:MAG: hypothetical protein Q7J82_07280 [Coriobacteriia bacterium]|nr:hypothetical protein [Coriobacteriia bacterium]
MKKTNGTPRRWPIIAAAAAGSVPALVAAWFMWAINSGALSEFGTVGFGISMLVIILWWMGVTIGVMRAALFADRMAAGVLAGAFSAVALVGALLLSQSPESWTSTIASPGAWLGALVIIAVPSVMGLLFAEKQLTRRR